MNIMSYLDIYFFYIFPLSIRLLRHYSIRYFFLSIVHFRYFSSIFILSIFFFYFYPFDIFLLFLSFLYFSFLSSTFYIFLLYFSFLYFSFLSISIHSGWHNSIPIPWNNLIFWKIRWNGTGWIYHLMTFSFFFQRKVQVIFW